MHFLREVFYEMGQVQWPSGKKLFKDTITVLFFIFVVAIFLGLVDELVTYAFNWFIAL